MMYYQLLGYQTHTLDVPQEAKCMVHHVHGMQKDATAAYTVTEAQVLPGGCGSTDPEVRMCMGLRLYEPKDTR